MHRKIFIDSFTVGIEDLPVKQRNIADVLAILQKAGRFSAFEATANKQIASVMTKILHEGYVISDNENFGYPWTGVRLTAKGIQAMRK